jgi:hypothetical protein
MPRARELDTPEGALYPADRPALWDTTGGSRMKISMQNMAIDSFAPVLQSLSRILDKAAAHGTATKIDLANARLAPDMYTLAQQVRIACAQARDCIARLTGKDSALRAPSPVDTDEQTIGDLKARIANTIVTLASAEAADFEGSEDRDCTIEIPNGGVIVMNGLQYLRSWALPQFYFHVVTAYDILRHHGVELGKKDYMGHVGAFIRRSETPPS